MLDNFEGLPLSINDHFTLRELLKQAKAANLAAGLWSKCVYFDALTKIEAELPVDEVLRRAKNSEIAAGDRCEIPHIGQVRFVDPLNHEDEPEPGVPDAEEDEENGED